MNPREEALALVSYCRCPPKGQRSNGPIRAAMYGVAGDYQKDRERRDPRHSNDRNAARMIRMGFRLTTIANDAD